MRNTLLFCLMLLWTITAQAQQVTGSAGLSPDQIEITQYDNFHHITYSGDEYIADEGYPRLPIIILSYVLPFDAAVSGLTITSQQEQKITGNYTIFPVQPPQTVGVAGSPVSAGANDSIYSLNRRYPDMTAEIVDDSYNLGYHVVTVRVYPVAYIPASGELYARQITFTIDYTPGAAPADVPRPETQSFRRSVASRAAIVGRVQNTTDVAVFGSGVKSIDSQVIERSITEVKASESNISGRAANVPISVMDYVTPDYIIITTAALKPEFQRLADWKTRKGVPTRIKLIEEIAREYAGVDTPEKIRNYLKAMESRWGSNIFVLLGGDAEIVPPRMVNNDNELPYASDRYFATTQGTWYSSDNKRSFMGPDLYSSLNITWPLGRIPAKTQEEARIMIDKVLRYEKLQEIPDKSYFSNHAATIAALSRTKPCKNNYMFHIKIKGYDVNGIVDPWLVSDNKDCTNPDFAFDTTEDNPPCITNPGANREMNKENFWQALNDSVPGKGHTHILYHMDHSNYYMMGTSQEHKHESLSVTEMNALTNWRYPQILVSGGCRPANFTKECIAEQYLKNPQSGGLAFIGNTFNGYFSEYRQMISFLNELYKSTGTDLPTRCSLGEAYNAAALTTGTDKDRLRLTLLGDPEMPVWTATPQKLNVTVSPDSISQNTGLMYVLVSGLPDGVTATICVQKGDEYYAVRNVRKSKIEFFQVKAKTVGEVTVTVTAHNYEPVLRTIKVVRPAHLVGLAKVTLHDDNSATCRGNGNGKAEAGETVELSVTLTNSDTMRVSRGMLQLRTLSPYVQLLDSIIEFEQRGLKDTITTIERLRFAIRPDAPEVWASQLDSLSLFFADITANNRTVTETFGLDIHAQEIQLRDRQNIRNAAGNTDFKAGDRITFRMNLFNAGQAGALEVKVVLSSISDKISCPVASIVFGDMEARVEKGIDVAITLTDKFSTGSSIPLNITITNEQGRQWNYSFDLTEKREAKIDATKVISFTDEDYISLRWPVVSDIRGYNVYREKIQNGISRYNKCNTYEILPSTFVDHGLTVHTSYRYRISAVSSTGLESALSDPVMASTACMSRPGFPIAYTNLFHMFRGDLVAADVNNDGYKELMGTITDVDAVHSGFLVGQTTTGADLFDYDNDPSTHGGIAYQEPALDAAPAIGDLYGDGQLAVITVTRKAGGPNYLTCYSMSDEDGDRRPDIRWQRAMVTSCDQPAILSDLDGDGRLEIIVYSDYTSTGIQVYDTEGNLRCSFNAGKYSGSPAIADLDGDTHKEIIVGNPDGVYIYRKDGTPFSDNPVFSRPGTYFNSAAIVCDLDSDGEKEIVISGVDKQASTPGYGTTSPVFALKADGTLLPGWDGSQIVRYSANWSNNKKIAVCDMNRDGRIEVVSIGMDDMKIWNNDGSVLRSITFPEVRGTGGVAPILADVDGDNQAEVIVAKDYEYAKYIWAYKLDGTMASGFPVHTLTKFKGSPLVTDIDGDGINELAGGCLNNVYVWNTKGVASPLDWGFSRGDVAYTGEYLSCGMTRIDLPEVWATPRDFCGDLAVSTDSLVVGMGCTVAMSDISTLTVESGAHLVIDGGSVVNANIRVLSGGKLTLQNNGTIRLRRGWRLHIEKGADFTNLQGTLMPR